MSTTPFTNIPDIVCRQIAQNISDSSSRMQLPSAVDYLQSVISEVTLETQTLGAALLTLVLIDLDWRIQRSGLCDVDSDGLLDQVDINYPNGTDVWWRLAMVEGTSDLTQANLTLTFQHRIVSYMQDDFGPLSVAPGTTTRAQFIKQLADRIPGSLDSTSLGPGSSDSQRILFVCPELNKIQPTASATGTTSTASTTVSTSTATADASAKINKSGGIGAGDTSVTVKGQAPTSAQLALINQVMGIANGLNAGRLATLALLEACIQENGFTNNASGSGTSIGLLQLETTTAASAGISALDVNACVTDFLTNGYNPNGGTGAIAYATAHPNATPDAVAQAIQGSGAGASFYAQWETEATAILNAGGGVTTGSLGSSTTTTTSSDVSQLTRGTSDNPDEDSWTCMQRLASEVNWGLFTDPHPHPTVWGNYLYYMTRPDMDIQKPSFYLDLDDSGTVWSATTDDGDHKTVVAGDGVISQMDYTFDNTAFQYQSTKKRKGKVQRKTKIATPQTPSVLKFNMIVQYPLQWNAGECIICQTAGPLNGRWIIDDVTHNTLKDTFAQFSCGPPTAPNPEPTVTPTASTTGGTYASTTGAGAGTLAFAAELALRAAQLEAQKHCYSYTAGAGRTNSGNGVLSPPYTYDCSGFTEACYKFAGLGDPGGNTNYAGTSYDISGSGACTQVSASAAVPGDCVVFPDHVVVYTGGGNCVSMGAEGEPVATTVAAETSGHGGNIVGYFHLKGAN